MNNREVAVRGRERPRKASRWMELAVYVPT